MKLSSNETLHFVNSSSFLTVSLTRELAKMDAQLLIWLVEHYTKVGETILDPMAGSGTTMLACCLGRNVILIELEQKFVDMEKANWEKVRMMPQLGYQMGTCQIIQGDARNLQDILVDKIITSPPYSHPVGGGDLVKRLNRLEEQGYTELVRQYREGNPKARNFVLGEYSDDPNNIGNLPYGDIDSVITSPPYAIEKTSGGLNTKPAKDGQQGNRNPNSPSQLGAKEGYGDSEGQISRLPYGSIDSVITSPPYTAFGASREGEKIRTGKSKIHKEKSLPTTYTEEQVKGNIGNLSYGNIDSVITSPPYEASVSDNKESPVAGGNEAKYGRWKDGTAKKRSYTQHGEPCKVDSIVTSPPYEGAMDGGSRHTKGGIPQRDLKMKRLGSYDTANKSNIGNLYRESYLSAMLQVYEQCHRVLKPGGLLILVTKNFIRNKKEVHLDEDTIRLCELAGFQLSERHYRKLPAQSFWRVIYRQKYPDVPVIDKEDILIFVKN